MTLIYINREGSHEESPSFPLRRSFARSLAVRNGDYANP